MNISLLSTTFLKRGMNLAVATILMTSVLSPLATLGGTAGAQTADFAQAVHSEEFVEIKFSQDATEAERAEVRAEFSEDIVDIKPLLGEYAPQAAAENSELSDYFIIKVDESTTTDKLSGDLESSSAVADAYPAPVAPPAPALDHSSLQTYFNPAPLGLGITQANDLPGGTGKNVQIADIEYGWNPNHEDLSNLRRPGAFITVGTPLTTFTHDHGTATAGAIVGDNNGYGITGAAYDSDFYMVNVRSYEYGWSPTHALYAAADRLQPGDIILLEQQTYGPDFEFLPVEWIPSTYEAIREITAGGITVIEAAGNGSVNLDDPKYGNAFSTGALDSGAIMVGAGAACGYSYNPNRTIMWFSNFGSTVDIQGPGECVATAGYGDLENNGVNAQYTSIYSGTSSASAVIAGAATVLASILEEHQGYAVSPAALRSHLMTYATPQHFPQKGGGNQLGHIGPQPDVYAAAKALTDNAPTIQLSGDSTLSLLVGSTYTEQGATCEDDFDTSCTVTIEGSVDTATPGTYIITYSATDSSENSSSVTRTVHVTTGDAPIITISGENPATVELGSTYTDAGATAYDAEDGDLTAQITTGGDAVDTSRIGTYTVRYEVTDSTDNTTTAVRTVHVADTTPPRAGSAADLVENSDTGNNTDNITANNTPTFSVECTEVDSILHVYTAHQGTNVRIATHTCAAAGHVELTSNPLADGQHMVTYTATDAAGNTSGASSQLDIQIDTATPNHPVVTSPTNGSQTSYPHAIVDIICNGEGNILTLSGDAIAGSPIHHVCGNSAQASIAIQITAEGETSISVTETNVAGTEGPATVVTFTASTAGDEDDNTDDSNDNQDDETTDEDDNTNDDESNNDDDENNVNDDESSNDNANDDQSDEQSDNTPEVNGARTTVDSPKAKSEDILADTGSSSIAIIAAGSMTTLLAAATTRTTPRKRS